MTTEPEAQIKLSRTVWSDVPRGVRKQLRAHYRELAAECGGFVGESEVSLAQTVCELSWAVKETAAEALKASVDRRVGKGRRPGIADLRRRIKDAGEELKAHSEALSQLRGKVVERKRRNPPDLTKLSDYELWQLHRLKLKLAGRDPAEAGPFRSRMPRKRNHLRVVNGQQHHTEE